MIYLGIDVGSSSVKAALLRDGKIAGEIARAPFCTRAEGVRVEVDPGAILDAVCRALRELGGGVRSVDAIHLTGMAPSWVAMDAAGEALTPIITHQDRRSVKAALELERQVGIDEHLRLAGNRPFPGGISSTTARWFRTHDPAVLDRASLLGHVTTFLQRRLTGARAIDPSNAAFMGLYSTLTLGGWDERLCAAAGVPMSALPEVMESDVIAGQITREGGEEFSLTAGTPVTAGLMDTGAALLLAGAAPGQLINVSGSTDVLGLCTDEPVPDRRLLTRPLGIGRRWMSVSTLAAAGSSLTWAHEALFPDLSREAFLAQVSALAAETKAPDRKTSGVRFLPYLAGDRMSITQRQASFTGLTLATTRSQLLAAVIESLAKASAARLARLRRVNRVKISTRVIVSGGMQAGLEGVLRRHWPNTWSYQSEPEATLRGLATIEPRRG